jgi:hypothetical protein
MLPEIATGSNWLNQTLDGVWQWAVHFILPSDPVPPWTAQGRLERPSLSQLARPGAGLPPFVAECAVARKYLDLLGPLDWDHFPERDPHRPWPGPKPAPRAPFVAAFLVKIDQGKRYMTHLRQYLVEHPALVWVLGFELTPSPDFPWGFDAEACLPSSRQFSRILRTLDNAALQFLLDGTVSLIGHELPEDILSPMRGTCRFGDVVAGDTKHIIAWVVENNPKVYIEDRYDKTRQPKGDPDCRLGCKKKRNRGEAEPTETCAEAVQSPATPPPTPTTDPVPASTVRVGEYYWGYASGVIATKVPDWGEFVLAELTQPFDRSDVSYFFPLMGDAERRLGFRPPCGAFDMAFEAHYVYDYFHQAGGFAAIRLSKRGDNTRQFDEAGLPLCKAGLAMPLKYAYMCRTTEVEHERGRYACPLLYPQPTGQACPIAHKNWEKGGCLVTMPTSIGARIRYQLDRDSQQFKDIYKQRTATERINSQALELGIERPKLRNGQAITNQNTFIYVLINLRALQRIRTRKVELARQPEATRALS